MMIYGVKCLIYNKLESILEKTYGVIITDQVKLQNIMETLE